MGASSGVQRALKAGPGVSYGTMAGVLLVLGGLSYAAVCQRGASACAPAGGERAGSRAVRKLVAAVRTALDGAG